MLEGDSTQAQNCTENYDTKDANNGYGYIGDTNHPLNFSSLDVHKFNLIAAGCGTGKSYFIRHTLLDKLNTIGLFKQTIIPGQVLIVTSRAITRDQQALDDGMVKYQRNEVLPFINGEFADMSEVIGDSMPICCYGDIIDAIKEPVTPGHLPLENIKVIIFDECHTLFSDSFIDDIEWLRIWINYILALGNQLVLGITATPSILGECKWGVVINPMTDEVITRYKAKQMICTDFDTLPDLFSGNVLRGKTLVMCPTIHDCRLLQRQVPNSEVIVSPRSKEYRQDPMDIIRGYIKEHESLPPTIRGKPLDVLICTSTAREGFNLGEQCGVRNVVSCFSDELHVTQFAGRCRYNLDTIVVADKATAPDNEYLMQSRKKFRLFLFGDGDNSWLDSVRHLVSGAVKKYVGGSNSAAFVQYVDTIVGEKLWDHESKCGLVSAAKRSMVLGKKNVTFKAVIDILPSFGYRVITGRMRIDGRQVTYKQILERNIDEMTYIPMKEGIDVVDFT